MNDIRGTEGQRWIRCNNWDGPPWQRQCIKRAMPGGAIYCKEHYPLHYSDTGLDSGPGLDYDYSRSTMYTSSRQQSIKE